MPGAAQSDEESDADEPVWGRMSMKRISQAIIETKPSLPVSRRPSLNRQSLSEASFIKPLVPPPPPPPAPPPPPYATNQRRGSESMCHPAASSGSSSRAAGSRLLQLTAEQISGQTWGTILQQQRALDSQGNYQYR